MITMLKFCCKGCSNYVSFESMNPRSAVTDEDLRKMGFTIVEKDGNKEYYCPKCRNKVPENCIDDDLAHYRISGRVAKTPWERYKESLAVKQDTDAATPLYEEIDYDEGCDEMSERFNRWGYQ